MRYSIIVNPKSGKGKSRSVLATLESIFDNKGLNYTISETNAKGHASDLAINAVNNGYTHIISVGGDGTLSEIVNSVYDKEVDLGVIPIGSGNDFSKSAGIPLVPDKAIQSILKGKIKKCDVAKLGDRVFINGFGIGLDGGVARLFKYLRFLGPYMGYKLGAIIEAFIFSGFSVRAISDNDQFEGRMLLCGASNGMTQGGIRLAPDARIDDGLLDFHFISDMNPILRLVTLTKAIKAQHTEMKQVRLIKSDKMSIEVFDDIPAHLDGEIFVLPKGIHEIEILKNRIKVIVP